MSADLEIKIAIAKRGVDAAFLSPDQKERMLCLEYYWGLCDIRDAAKKS